jgi:hypothetical protein
VIVVLAQSLRWHALISGEDILSIVVILLLGLVVFVPAWYCMYRLGFKMKKREKAVTAKVSTRKTQR